MPIEIKSGPDFAIIDCELDEGESIVAESGALVSMSSSVHMKTEARGGVLAEAKRKLLGGESIFQNTYTAERGPGRVMLAPGSAFGFEQYLRIGIGQEPTIFFRGLEAAAACFAELRAAGVGLIADPE